MDDLNAEEVRELRWLVALRLGGLELRRRRIEAEFGTPPEDESE